MKIKRLLISTGTASAFVFGVVAAALGEPAKPIANKPNVIVILADDQGYADLGVQGQVKDVRTPNIDALAAGGVRCTSGYVTAPQCSPSRAGLITGRYQQKFGLDNIPDDPMPLTEVTIPERLKKAGYVSGMVGKCHLNPNALSLKWARKNLSQAKPNAQGRIQIPARYLRQYSALAQRFDECFQGEMLRCFTTFDLAGQALKSAGQPLPESGFRLDIQTQAALAFLQRAVRIPRRCLSLMTHDGEPT